MSKFHSLQRYIQDREYNLLPFRFDRFDSNRYILTNIVGEFLLLSNQDFQDLIDKKLPTSTKIFKDLRSKQFICYVGEIAPLELLGLKLRTKNSTLPHFTNLHIFVVTLRCDHSCPYCQVSRQKECVGSFDMTTEIADKALDFTFKSSNQAIKIEFQGGEPLLNFEMVKYIVLKAKEINATEHRNLEFVIATTLSLLTDEILTFCKQNNIYLSSSLDGPDYLHNQNRPRRGKNSHMLFEQGLSKARQVLGIDSVSALMTTTDISLPLHKEIIDEYIRLKFDGIFLRFLSPYGFAIKTKRFMSYDSNNWFDFYKQGLEYIISLNKSGVRFVEYYAALILTKMLSCNDPGFVDLMHPAGAGIKAIVFNYDGLVYASDESRMLAEMGVKDFCLGNLLNNSYEDMILSDNLLDTIEDSFAYSNPMCSDCAYIEYCGSDPVFHFATQGDIVGRKPESEFCNRNMSIFKLLIEMMEDEETKQIFLGWVNKC